MKNGFRPKEKIPEQPHVPPMPIIAQPQFIQKCKYLLPCGICDRSGKMCSQYGYEVTKIFSESEIEENFGNYEVIKNDT